MFSGQGGMLLVLGLLVTSLPGVYPNLLNWWNTATTTPHPNALELPSCSGRPCILEAGRVSCPYSKCTAIDLEQIPDDVIDLQLQENEIMVVPVLHFTHLVKLDLSKNWISRIEHGAFDQLKNLTQLYLSHNRLKTVEKTFFRSLINLKYLYLDSNGLTTIENFYPWLVSIETLDLSRNAISGLPEGGFSQLTTLRHLHLDYNQLTNISRAMFKQMPQLEELTLHQNRLVTIPSDTFGDLLKLDDLDLGYNNITHIANDSFTLTQPSFHQSQLRRLVLSRNNLTVLPPGAFSGLESLQTLHLQGNPLEELDAGRLPAGLVQLSMHHMPRLRRLRTGALDGLSRLRTVEVYANPCLTMVDSGSLSADFTDLKFLDLSRNALQTMPENAVKSWVRVESVDLSGNPWSCDCNLKWMMEVYMKASDRRMIRCHTPIPLMGHHIVDLSSSQFVCGRFPLGARERAGVLMVVLSTIAFLTGISVFVYRFRRRIFPCHYGQTSNYRALYNTDDAENEVTIAKTISVSETEKKILQAEAKAGKPEPVAL